LHQHDTPLVYTDWGQTVIFNDEGPSPRLLINTDRPVGGCLCACYDTQDGVRGPRTRRNPRSRRGFVARPEGLEPPTS
jgi:hypothetical protein